MPHVHGFLENLALVLGIAAIVTIVFQKLKQPAVLGYVLAGMIVGPNIPIPVTADVDTIHILSELGVIFLMFSLGLEFSIRKLVKAIPTAGIIALIQCSLMMWLGYLTGKALGWTAQESLYVGAIVAISSTTIIIKVFSEEAVKGEVLAIVSAILIIEDLIAVLLMAGLTPLSQHTHISSTELARTTATLFIFLLILIASGLFFIPRLMRQVARLKRPETTLITSIGICFATALLAKQMGYSVALGAFIAGSLIAESQQDHVLEHQVHPLRDMFGAVFFVSVGMLIDPSAIITHWKAIAALTLLVIVGKLLSVTLGALIVGRNTRTAVQTGMSMAQIGEFSFIIAAAGLSTGATRDFLYPITVAVSILTTLATPWLIRASNPAAHQINHYLPRRIQTFLTLYGTWIDKLTTVSKLSDSKIKRLFRILSLDLVILIFLIIGSALSFSTITDHLKNLIGLSSILVDITTAGIILLLAIPLAIGIFTSARQLGFTLATAVLPLAKDGSLDIAAAPRRAFIVALQLIILLMIGIVLLAVTQPVLPVYYSGIAFGAWILIAGIVFWKRATDLQGHVRAGAELILETLTQPDPTLSTPSPTPPIETLLPGLGAITSITLNAQMHGLGQTLTELDLRNLTGATIIAIKRENTSLLIPTGTDRLEIGDILIMTGSAQAIELTKHFFLSGRI